MRGSEIVNLFRIAAGEWAASAGGEAKLLPGVEYADSLDGEVPDVARDEREVAFQRGRGNHAVGHPVSASLSKSRSRPLKGDSANS